MAERPRRYKSPSAGPPEGTGLRLHNKKVRAGGAGLRYLIPVPPPLPALFVRVTRVEQLSKASKVESTMKMPRVRALLPDPGDKKTKENKQKALHRRRHFSHKSSRGGRALSRRLLVACKPYRRAVCWSQTPLRRIMLRYGKRLPLHARLDIKRPPGVRHLPYPTPWQPCRNARPAIKNIHPASACWSCCRVLFWPVCVYHSTKWFFSVLYRFRRRFYRKNKSIETSNLDLSRHRCRCYSLNFAFQKKRLTMYSIAVIIAMLNRGCLPNGLDRWSRLTNGSAILIDE